MHDKNAVWRDDYCETVKKVKGLKSGQPVWSLATVISKNN